MVDYSMSPLVSGFICPISLASTGKFFDERMVLMISPSRTTSDLYLHNTYHPVYIQKGDEWKRALKKPISTTTNTICFPELAKDILNKYCTFFISRTISWLFPRRQKTFIMTSQFFSGSSRINLMWKWKNCWCSVMQVPNRRWPFSESTPHPPVCLCHCSQFLHWAHSSDLIKELFCSNSGCPHWFRTPGKL